MQDVSEATILEEVFDPEGAQGFMREAYKIAFQAIVVIAISAGIAFFVNGAREVPLPIIMPFQPEYHCASGMEAGPGLTPEAALASFGKAGTVFVDARPGEDYGKGHIQGAINLPYSFLEPLPEDAMNRLKTYRIVVVYCNTREGQTSKLMAGEIYRSGIKDAFYLEGGLLAWTRAGGSVTGQPLKDYE